MSARLWDIAAVEGMPRSLAAVRFLAFLTCLLCVTLTCVFLLQPASQAWAEDSSSASAASAEEEAEDSSDNEASDDNRVDPTQRADNSFIYDTTIESLSGQSSLYEGRTVQVVGEVIGDRIAAEEQGFCWITLTSTDENNKSTISALVSLEAANQIDQYGKYGVVGTTFQVRGIYHQACSEHEGLPDIHATTASPLSRGVVHRDPFSLRAFLPGGILVVIGLALMAVYYYIRERSR